MVVEEQVGLSAAWSGPGQVRKAKAQRGLNVSREVTPIRCKSGDTRGVLKTKCT